MSVCGRLWATVGDCGRDTWQCSTSAVACTLPSPSRVCACSAAAKIEASVMATFCARRSRSSDGLSQRGGGQ